MSDMTDTTETTDEPGPAPEVSEEAAAPEPEASDAPGGHAKGGDAPR